MDRAEATELILERLTRALDAPLGNRQSVTTAMANAVAKTLREFEDDVRFSATYGPNPVVEGLKAELEAARKERDRANALYWELKTGGKDASGGNGAAEYHRNGDGRGSEVSGVQAE
jgi:hypothetical protein